MLRRAAATAFSCGPRRGLLLAPGRWRGRACVAQRRRCGSQAKPVQHVSTSPQKGMTKQEQVHEFISQLRKPDYITVSGNRARRHFGLTKEQLETLETIEAPNPYRDDTTAYELYWLSDVVTLALETKTEKELIERYKALLLKGRPGEEAARRIYGMNFTGTDRWYTNPSSETVEGKKSIVQGLRSNLVIFGGKLLASKYTGSFALFADAMHSLADVSNYLYRYYSITSSQKKADSNHPYGYAPLRHICADRSFVGLLLVGGVIPVCVGAYELLELVDLCITTPMDPYLSMLSGSVLLLSLAMEGLAMRTARNEMQERSIRHKPKDIMSEATFLEARAGVYGVLVGMSGVIATYVLGSAIVEVCASILMGSIVSAVAIGLLSRSGTMLLGATLPVERVTTVIEKLHADDIVVEVYDVKTQVISFDTVRFKAEIHYNAEAITKRRLGLHRVPSLEATTLFNEISQVGCETAAEDWLMRNDAEFLLAFARETARLRDIVRKELSEYENVHVDLNIW